MLTHERNFTFNPTADLRQVHHRLNLFSDIKHIAVICFVFVI